MPRENWTDERLDDLNKKVDDGFADTKAEMRTGFTRVDGEIRELRSEMNARFNSIDARFDKLNDSVNARFDRMQHTLIGSAVAVVLAIIGSSAF